VFVCNTRSYSLQTAGVEFHDADEPGVKLKTKGKSAK
jgi:hypothetical protein